MQTKELVYVSSCQSPSLRFGCSHTHTHTCTVSSNTYTPHKFIDAHVSPDAFGRPHPQVETYSHVDEKSSFISELIDAFTGVQKLSECRCSSCGVPNQQAESSMLFSGVQPNFCAFQVLRFFQDRGRRENLVYVDPVLNFGSSEYRLSSVTAVLTYSIPDARSSECKSVKNKRTRKRNRGGK